jgi:uncharacterized membrane protein YccC
VLWTLLPIAIFAAAYVPRVASFAAGQAAFTMTVLIILNLIAPMGWQLGLVRIEDITAGAGAAVTVVVSVLLWPRGATGSVSAAVDAAFELGSRYLRAAAFRVTRGASGETDVGKRRIRARAARGFHRRRSCGQRGAASRGSRSHPQRTRADLSVADHRRRGPT